MKIKQILSVIWLILLLAFFIPYSSKITLPADENSWIQQIQTDWIQLDKNNLLAGTILISQNNQVIYSQGDLDQKYAIGSITKSFVGYYFYEHPHLKSNRVCNYIQQFCQSGLSQITVNDLLLHRANLAKTSELKIMLSYSFGLENHLDKIEEFTIKPEFIETSKIRFRYSNLGYLYLSRIIELSEKKYFETIMNEIFQDLSLNNTSVATTSNAPKVVLLIPWTPIRIQTSFINQAARSFGAGGIISTASDLQKWFQILNETEMKNNAEQNPDHYAAGLISTQNHLGNILWHNGAVLGFRSLSLITENKLQIILLTNHLKPFEFLESCLEPFESFYKKRK